MKSKRKTPDIRFRGFTDDWEQYKLGEVSYKVTKKNIENDFSETFTNSAEHGIINQRDFFDKDISNEKNLNGYYVVNEDDFVYNPRISNFAPVGPIKRNKLGRTGVMSPLYYVFKTHNIDKTYLEYYFDTTEWHKFMKLNGDSGARSDRFAIKDSVFKEMPIPYPNEREQIQIGTFFQSLDNLITLHQRKLQQLKDVKRGMLLKMFPKKTSLVPIIRNVKYKENWKRVTLNSVLTIPNKEKVEIKSADKLLTVKLNLKGIEKGSNRETLSLGSTNYYKRYSGQFIYGKQNFFNGGFGLISKELDGYSSSADVPSLNIENVDENYFWSYISREWYWRPKEALAIGTGSKRIHEEVLLKFPIEIPTTDEQIYIGSIFKKLDRMIELQKREIELLEETKKGLLQKMFV